MQSFHIDKHELCLPSVSCLPLQVVHLLLHKQLEPCVVWSVFIYFHIYKLELFVVALINGAV